MSTPIRLPLSQRQADVLAIVLAKITAGEGFYLPDEVAALREVAGKLDTLREK